MSWTAGLIEESYPLGSLWWYGEHIVRIKEQYVGLGPHVICENVETGKDYEVDINQKDPGLTGPISALELLAEEAE